MLLFGFGINSNATSKNSDTLIINPEMNKKILRKRDPNYFNIHQVSIEKIKYHQYEMGEVMSKKYRDELNFLETNKREYSMYQDVLKKQQQEKDDLGLCIELIDEYLKSDLKFDLKKEYLIQSREIARKYGIYNIRGSDYSEFYIYQETSKPNKNDLKFCRDYIFRVIQAVIEPEKSNSYIEYVSRLENLQKIDKTMPGLVKSLIESERQAKLVEEKKMDINTFSGSFIIVKPGPYFLNKNIEDPDNLKSFVENELIDYESYKKSERKVELNASQGQLLKEINSNEEYFLPAESWYYLERVRNCQKDIELLNILHDLGYKEYYKEYYDYKQDKYNKTFIQTKTAEIELREDDYTLLDLLKENKSALSNFDNDRNKFLSLMKQCTTYTSSLSDFINIYNIKRNETPISTINAWKTKAIIAKKLLSQILVIRSKYAFIYTFLEFQNDSSFDVFLDKSILSSNILGIQ